jgi:hypothetical protein
MSWTWRTDRPTRQGSASVLVLIHRHLGGREGYVPYSLPCADCAGPSGIGAVYLVWLGFIASTEFFVAYPSEGPLRELLAISLLMAVAIAVVPDDAGQRDLPNGAGHGQ